MARYRGTAREGSAFRGTRGESPVDRSDAPWPSLAGRGPRQIPVVGPTEALRGRAGGPGVEVPPGAVHGLLDHASQSGWQLAQQVWQDSGIGWQDAQDRREDPQDRWQDAAEGGQKAPDRCEDPKDRWEEAADRWQDAPDRWDDDMNPWGDVGNRWDDAQSRDDARSRWDNTPVPFPVDAGDAGDAGDPVSVYAPDRVDAGRYPTDPHPTRPDLPVLRVSAGSGQGTGPWPARPPVADGELAEDNERKEHRPGDREPAERTPQDREQADRGPGERGFADRDGREAAGPAAPDAAGQAAEPQAPPLPRRIRMADLGTYPRRDPPGRPGPVRPGPGRTG
ncbi:MAG TPA: hypothetical protein VIZ43_06300, partial [Trebonia sp.]